MTLKEAAAVNLQSPPRPPSPPNGIRTVPARLMAVGVDGDQLLRQTAVHVVADLDPDSAADAANTLRQGTLAGLSVILHNAGLTRIQQHARAAAERDELHAMIAGFVYDLGYEKGGLSDVPIAELPDVLSEVLEQQRAGGPLGPRLDELATQVGKVIDLLSANRSATVPGFPAAGDVARFLDAVNQRILAGSPLNITGEVAPWQAAAIVEQHVTALRSNAQRDAHRLAELTRQLDEVRGQGNTAAVTTSPRETELLQQLEAALRENGLLRDGILKASINTGTGDTFVARDAKPLPAEELVAQLNAKIGALTAAARGNAGQPPKAVTPPPLSAMQVVGAALGRSLVSQDLSARLRQVERDRNNLMRAAAAAIEELTGRPLNQSPAGGMLQESDSGALINLLRHETGRIARKRIDDAKAGIVNLSAAAFMGTGEQMRQATDRMAALLSLATTFYPAKVHPVPGGTTLDFQVALFLPVAGQESKTVTTRWTLPGRLLPWFDHLEHENQHPVVRGSEHERILDEVARRVAEHPNGPSELANLRKLRRSILILLDGRPEGEGLDEEATNKQLAKALRTLDERLTAEELGAGLLESARKEATNLEQALHEARQERDHAYTDRAHVLAVLSAHYRDSARMAYSDRAAPDWPVLTLDLEQEAPKGFMASGPKPKTQVSWHIAPPDLALFPHVPWQEPGVVAMGRSPLAWDGHTRDEKNRRLVKEAARIARMAPDFKRLPKAEEELRTVSAERNDLREKQRILVADFESVLGVLSAHYPAQLEVKDGSVWRDATLWLSLPPTNLTEGHRRDVWFPVSGTGAQKLGHVVRTAAVDGGRCEVSERSSRLWDEAKRLAEYTDAKKAQAQATLDQDAESPAC
jgi:hypothetical protein